MTAGRKRTRRPRHPGEHDDLAAPGLALQHTVGNHALSALLSSDAGPVAGTVIAQRSFLDDWKDEAENAASSAGESMDDAAQDAASLANAVASGGTEGASEVAGELAGDAAVDVDTGDVDRSVPGGADFYVQQVLVIAKGCTDTTVLEDEAIGLADSLLQGDVEAAKALLGLARESADAAATAVRLIVEGSTAAAKALLGLAGESADAAATAVDLITKGGTRAASEALSLLTRVGLQTGSSRAERDVTGMQHVLTGGTGQPGEERSITSEPDDEDLRRLRVGLRGVPTVGRRR